VSVLRHTSKDVMPGTSPGITSFVMTQQHSRVLDVLLKTGIDQFALHQNSGAL